MFLELQRSAYLPREYAIFLFRICFFTAFSNPIKYKVELRKLTVNDADQEVSPLSEDAVHV